MLWTRYLALDIRVSCPCRQPGRFKYADKRLFAHSGHLPQQSQPTAQEKNEWDRTEEEAEVHREVGRMTERLTQMTEESMETGGSGAKKAVEEAGFSEELKKKLEERIQESTFRSENAAAFAETNLPVCN